MVWRVIEGYAHELSSNYLFAYRQLKNTAVKDLKDYCLNDVASKMPDVLGSVYIQDHFGEDHRNKVGYVNRQSLHILFILKFLKIYVTNLAIASTVYHIIVVL